MTAFFVHGVPAPQGSKRHVGGGRMIESSARVGPWREAVKAAAQGLFTETLTGPVWVRVDFYMPRPKSHYRTGANAHLLRDNAPMYVAVKPDIDKCVRSTLDALGDMGAYGDDAQVAKVTACMYYADAPTRAGAVIDIEALT
jgi:crossover junction endodeoxyribonuclease RusA